MPRLDGYDAQLVILLAVKNLVATDDVSEVGAQLAMDIGFTLGAGLNLYLTTVVRYDKAEMGVFMFQVDRLLGLLDAPFLLVAKLAPCHVNY